MLRFLALLLLAGSSIVANASEGVHECKFGTFEQMSKDKSCACSKEQPIKIDVPKAAKFLGVCNYKIFQSGTEFQEIWGEFFYKTNKIYSGAIKYEPSEAGDLFFDVKKEDASFKFTGSKRDIQKLKVPSKLQAACMTAKATIRVKKFHDFIDGGTDSMGRYLDDYEVISLEKYNICK